MRPDLRLEKLRAGPAWLLSAAFFILLWLPLVDWAFHLDHAPMPNEKRAPARFPDLASGARRWHQLVSDLDAYYSDHFGFRNRLIRWNNRWKRKWFKESSVADVMIGRQGWLYFTGND